MKKLANKLIYLVSPTLIYLAIQGSQGAKNLLVAWVVFGFVTALFTSFVIAAMIAANSGAEKMRGAEKTAKTKETAEKFFEQVRKAKKMRLTDWLVVVYMAIFAWQGWWVLLTIDAIGYAILKFTALFIPDKEV